MAMQPDQVEVGMRQDTCHRVRGMATFEREPELLVTDPRGDCAVPVDVDVRGSPG